MDHEFEKIRNVIIDQAKYFLAEAKEFYPFGAFIDRLGNVVPFGVHMENDHPHSQEVIDALETAIMRKLRNNEIKLAAIGTDVFYQPPGELEQTSAIQVRSLHVNGESVDYYLPYKEINEGFLYGNLVTERGSLKFF